MDKLQHIFEVIAQEGFAEMALKEINNYINDIQNGTEDFFRFNLSEHAGLCKGGTPLIGASIVACYARRSLTTSSNVAVSETSGPANWEIDELQEKLIEEWAKATNLWEDNSEQILTDEFGPMVAMIIGKAKVLTISQNACLLRTCTLPMCSSTS